MFARVICFCSGMPMKSAVEHEVCYVDLGV